MRIAAFSHYFVVENAFMSRIYIPFPTINRQKNIEYFTRKKNFLTIIFIIDFDKYSFIHIILQHRLKTITEQYDVFFTSFE